MWSDGMHNLWELGQHLASHRHSHGPLAFQPKHSNTCWQFPTDGDLRYLLSFILALLLIPPLSSANLGSTSSSSCLESVDICLRNWPDGAGSRWRFRFRLSTVYRQGGPWRLLSWQTTWGSVLDNFPSHVSFYHRNASLDLVKAGQMSQTRLAMVAHIVRLCWYARLHPGWCQAIKTSHCPVSRAWSFCTSSGLLAQSGPATHIGQWP